MEILLVPPIDEILRQFVGGSFKDHERRAVIIKLDFVERGQDRHTVRIKRSGPRLEHFLQFVAQRLIDLFFGDVRGDLGDFCGDVCSLAEEDAKIDPLEQIPSLSLNAAERGLDFRYFKQWINQRFDQFAVG